MVHPLRGADPRLRAVANILTTDGYAINGIRVYEDKGKMYVRFPIVHSEARAWKAGRAANFAFTPCTHAARREIEGAILEAYKMENRQCCRF